MLFFIGINKKEKDQRTVWQTLKAANKSFQHVEEKVEEKVNCNDTAELNAQILERPNRAPS